MKRIVHTLKHLAINAAYLIAMGCSVVSPKYENGKAVIAESQLKIAGVTVGSSEAAITKAFGSTEYVYPGVDFISNKPSKDIRYQGIWVYLVDDKVVNLRCSLKQFKTPDGLHAGQSIEDVKRLFGATEVYSFRDQQSMSHPVPHTGKALVVHLRDNIVKSIELCYE